MCRFTVLLLLMVMVAGPAAADNFDESQLKTLFTDKKQRDYIDAMRAGKRTGEQAPTEKVRVKGYMIRSDGNSVVWVNDKSTLDGNKLGDLRVHDRDIDSSGRVVISSDGRRKRLKPGETWDRQSGKVSDAH